MFKRLRAERLVGLGKWQRYCTKIYYREWAIDGLAVRAISFITKAAPLVNRVVAFLATGAVMALGSIGVDKLSHLFTMLLVEKREQEGDCCQEETAPSEAYHY